LERAWNKENVGLIAVLVSLFLLAHEIGTPF
jgi:uncharacterized membrane protein